ncbi:MAG TPA: pilin [bacterium]|nr:pilin [bacterium]
MKIFLSVFIVVVSLLSTTTFVLAEGSPPPLGDGSKIEESKEPDVVRLDNPLGTEVNDVPTLIGKVISGVLSVVGSLALVMFIYGGFTWMLAAGNTEKVKKGRDILIWAALGLVIIFTSYAMVTYVITTISKT